MESLLGQRFIGSDWVVSVMGFPSFPLEEVMLDLFVQGSLVSNDITMVNQANQDGKMI